MDYDMPRMDGFEFARRLKSSPSLAHIPIIAFTASVLKTELIEYSENFDGFLYKPVRLADIFAEFSKFLKHTIEYPTKKIEKPRKTNLDKLPDNIVVLWPEIKKILEGKFLSHWKTIKDHLVLFRIEE